MKFNYTFQYFEEDPWNVCLQILREREYCEKYIYCRNNNNFKRMINYGAILCCVFREFN